MKIKIVAFGIAKEILKSKELMFEIREGDTIATLKRELFDRYPDLASLKSLSFAVGENYQEDSFSLTANDEVVILPPVSGG